MEAGKVDGQYLRLVECGGRAEPAEQTNSTAKSTVGFLIVHIAEVVHRGILVYVEHLDEKGVANSEGFEQERGRFTQMPAVLFQAGQALRGIRNSGFPGFI